MEDNLSRLNRRFISQDASLSIVIISVGIKSVFGKE